MRGLRAAPLESWNEHFWMLFENMFCEASARMPETTALRIVSAVWWIAIVVLMNAFAGQMRACLMVKSERPKLNTLVDIASKPQLKVYLLKNTVATRYLESSQGTAEKTVWGMIRRHNTDLYGLLRFSDEMMTEILQEKAVMIHADSISLAQVCT
ncbi:ionotropic receptor 93a-like [Dermacentor silvarum]|uniref:ionotropic receptor 93a-like n=1 Tax=Dermacentor silvarum TaxID=543639 RepID=UPI002101811E|nr:ionotropic receptor 93a-like [Dermacentor silvarum]